MKFTQTPTDIEIRAKKKINYSKLDLAFVMIILKEREFINTLQEMRQQLSSANLANLFIALTSSNFLNVHDFLNFAITFDMSILEKDLVNLLINRFDLNNDGKTTFDDFAILF
jgi:hypothetical protein